MHKEERSKTNRTCEGKHEEIDLEFSLYFELDEEYAVQISDY